MAPATAIPRGGITAVADLAALKARYPRSADAVYVRSEDDLFIWDKLSTETVDDVDVLLRNGQVEETPGRWIREVRPSTVLNASGERLEVGEIADGAFVQRVGDQLVGGTPGGGAGSVVPRDQYVTTVADTTSVTLNRVVSAGWEASVSMSHGAIPYVRVTSDPDPGEFRVSGNTVTIGDTIPSGRVLVFRWLEPGA